MTAALLDMRGTQPGTPSKRLVLHASPATLQALGDVLRAVPIAAAVAPLALVLGNAVDQLTGGITTAPDPAMPDGAWRLTADGATLTEGTIRTCAS